MTNERLHSLIARRVEAHREMKEWDNYIAGLDAQIQNELSELDVREYVAEAGTARWEQRHGSVDWKTFAIEILGLTPQQAEIDAAPYRKADSQAWYVRPALRSAPKEALP